MEVQKNSINAGGKTGLKVCSIVTWQSFQQMIYSVEKLWDNISDRASDTVDVLCTSGKNTGFSQFEFIVAEILQ